MTVKRLDIGILEKYYPNKKQTNKSKLNKKLKKKLNYRPDEIASHQLKFLIIRMVWQASTRNLLPY